MTSYLLIAKFRETRRSGEQLAHRNCEIIDPACTRWRLLFWLTGHERTAQAFAAAAARFSTKAKTYLPMNEGMEVLCLNLRMAQTPRDYPLTGAQTHRVSSRIRLRPLGAPLVPPDDRRRADVHNDEFSRQQQHGPSGRYSHLHWMRPEGLRDPGRFDRSPSSKFAPISNWAQTGLTGVKNDIIKVSFTCTVNVYRQSSIRPPFIDSPHTHIKSLTCARGQCRTFCWRESFRTKSATHTTW